MDDALAEHGAHATLLFNRGLVFERTGAYARAEAAYRQALSVRPGYSEALVHLGNVLVRQERLEEAEASFRAAVDSDADFFPALYSLAAVLERQGLDVAAQQAYEEALALRPHDTEAWLGAARTAPSEDARRKTLEQALACASSVPALFKAGHIAARFEHLDIATRALERVLALDANHAEARYTLAVVYWFSGGADAALAQADEVERLARASSDTELVARSQRLKADIRKATLRDSV